MLQKLILGISLILLSPFYFSTTIAQIPSPVSFELINVPNTVMVNEEFKASFKVSIEGDWHLYGLSIPKGGPIATNFKVKSTNATLSGSVEESKADLVFDPNFKMEVSWHKSGAVFTLPLKYISDLEGPQLIEVTVQYMVCNDQMCLPPTKKTLTIPIEINGKLDVVETPTTQNDDSEYTEIVSEGVASFIWIALTAGFAALLTPCVFPMIPLTVSFFSKQSDGKSSKSIINALLFGLAIVGMFTFLGAMLSLILGASGANLFASNPWVNLTIGLIFIIFAASLLGMFELQLPYQLTNFLNKKSNESSGIIGILFMGLTISAVSFSCTAPFVGGVLAATTQGQWFYPILGMMAFSTAFASPFVLFAMFPEWLNTLPKSGSWMNQVKVILGFIELAAAIKFLSNADLVWRWEIISRPFSIAIWISIAILIAMYILGKIRFEYEKPVESINTTRLLFSIPFLTLAIYLLPGLFGASLGIWDAYLPPKQASDVSIVSGLTSRSSDESEWDKWSSSVEESQEKGKKSQKLLFVDFTGYTCTNCRAMESNVFPESEVQSRFNQFELVRLYTDDGVDGEKNQLYQFNLTGTVALPTYAIIEAETGRLIAKKSGYINKEEFVSFLDKTLNKQK